VSDIEWRPIPGWEGYYEASSKGAIRSVDRVVVRGKRTLRLSGSPRVPKVGKNGYLYTSLYRSSEASYSTVHRLVALTFLGPRPVGHDVCHRNGVRSDNRVENLYYGTRSENNRDKRIHGTDHNASKTRCAQGHPFDDENTYLLPDRSRKCKQCATNRWHNKKTGVSDRVRGHGLYDLGAPVDITGTPTNVPGSGAGGKGRALCACGAMSPEVSSVLTRRKWHREHKEQVLKELLP